MHPDTEIYVRIHCQKLVPKHLRKKGHILRKRQLSRIIIMADHAVTAVCKLRINRIILLKGGQSLRIVIGESALSRLIGNGVIRPCKAGELCPPHP